MRFLSLFSGIGGLDLGLERAGFQCVGQVEIDPYCRAVLAKHWPNVKRVADVREVRGVEDFPNFDVLAAGFPCQPVSQNGRKKAQDDERWLWPETARCIRLFRPLFVLLENVTGLLVRGFSEVLGDLAAIGYDAEWDSVPAAALGAPHLRERVFVVSYPTSEGPQGEEPAGRIWGRGLLAQCDRWCPEPPVRRVDDGTSRRVERIAGLGNLVVPQVAEVIGRAILAASSKETARAAVEGA